MALKRKKVLCMAAGVTVLAVCALVLTLLLNIQVFKPQIEAAASDALGMEVRIKGRLGVALFPGIGISLKEISVRNKGAEVVIAEKMKVGLEFIALIRREVRITRIGFIRPVLSLVRYKNGMFNVEKPGRTPSGRPIAVEKISVSKGSIVYTDEETGDRIAVKNVDATMRNLSYSWTEGGKLLQSISFAGDISCKALSINTITLTNLAMKTAAGKGTLDINRISMDIFGGTGKGRIHVDGKGPSPHYHVITTLDRFRIEEMIQAFSPGNSPRKSMEGTVSFTADLTARGTSADEVKRSLNGDLSVNGKDLIFSGIDIDVLIPKYERSQNFNLVDVGAYFLAGPFGPVVTKSYNFASLYNESRVGKSSITKLVSIWSVKNGIAEAADVAFATKKYRVAMKGGLNFNNDQFADVTVAVLDKRGCAVYSQKVHGPFREPRTEKISVFKSITGSITNALEDARLFMQGDRCAVFYSGSVAQPEG